MDAAERQVPRQLALVFALGFFSLAAQALLFRDFLVAFEGHEIALGLFFGSWLIWVAVGAWLARGGRGLSAFCAGALLYIPAFVGQHLFIVLSRRLAGVEAFELFPLQKMIPFSLLANAPVSLVTGFLFTLACGWTARRKALPAVLIYMVESGGAVVGGAMTTALLAVGCREARVFMLVSSVLLAAVIAAAPGRRLRRLSGGILLAIVILSILRADQTLTRIEDRWTWSRLLPATSFQGGFITPQARYLYGVYEGQFNVMAWESIGETVPDTEHASEIAALNMARAPEARRVLVVGPGSLSLCQRLLTLPGLESVTWLHPDPSYPGRLLAVLPPDLRPPTERLLLPERDIRTFLEAERSRYDLVLLNIPDATTLVMNRFFSREFLELASRRLTPAGIISVRIPGGENFLGGELANLGAGVYATLQAIFPRMTLKPGDESWIMGSRGALFDENIASVVERYRAIPGAANLYPPEGLAALYPRDRILFQKALYEDLIRSRPAGYFVNTDDRPLIIRFSLLWLGKQAVGGKGWMPLLANPLNGLAQAIFTISLAMVLIVLYRLRAVKGPGEADRRAGTELAGGVFMALVGWIGLATSLILMFQFQMRFGSLFLHAGLVSALFMVGLTVGGGVVRNIVWRKIGLLPIAVAVWLIHLLLLALWMGGIRQAGYPLFAGMFLLAGLCQGAYVPLPAAAFKRDGMADILAGAAMECGDNIGGAVGGILAGLIMLPLFGIRLSIMVLMLLLMLGGVVLFGLLAQPRRAPGSPIERRVRWAGYVGAGLVLSLLFHAVLNTMVERTDRDARLLQAGKRLAPECVFTRKTGVLADGTPWSFYLGCGTGETETVLFETAPLIGNVSGYAGPLNLAVLMQADGTLLGLDMLESGETARYVDFLRGWRRALPGRNLLTPQTWKELDGRTGATITSRAILTILERAGARLPMAPDERKTGTARGLPDQRGKPDPAAAVLIGFTVGAWLLRRHPGRIRRRIFLVASALVLGFLFNVQYALFHVCSLLSLHLPAAAFTTPFLLIVLVPVLVLLCGNIYCGYVCPFGALQELLGEWIPAAWRRDPTAETWVWGRRFKYLALFLVLTVFAVHAADLRVADGDPLAAFFRELPRGSGRVLMWLILLAAVVYRRFWCRNLCPAGAFLSLLSGARILARWRPEVYPGKCDLGVRHRQELDCLSCDRCRLPSAATATVFKPQSGRLFLLLVGGAGILLIGLCRPAVKTDETAAESAVVRSGGGAGVPRQVKVERIRRLIREGQLSDREARYYKPRTNAAPPEIEK